MKTAVIPGVDAPRLTWGPGRLAGAIGGHSFQPLAQTLPGMLDAMPAPG